MSPSSSPSSSCMSTRTGQVLPAPNGVRSPQGSATRSLVTPGRPLARLLAALAPGGLLLRGVAAAAASAALPALAAPAALSAPARGAGRVRDRGGPRLAHALLAQTLVLLVVFHARSVVLRHRLYLHSDRRRRAWRLCAT